MLEGEYTTEYLNPSFGFGDVVIRIDKNNERCVIVDLPDPDSKKTALNVSSIVSDQEGNEILGAGGTTTLDQLIPLKTEQPWTPEKIAVASMRRFGMTDENTKAELISVLETEAQKPRIRQR